MLNEHPLLNLIRPWDSSLILVVDDDTTMRLILRDFLEEEGYRVAEAGDGLEALTLFQEVQPDAVLMDLYMPRLHGIATCKQLKALPGGEQTPILMLTAAENEELVDQAFEAGASEYIRKPPQWAVLRQRLRRLLQSRHTEQLSRLLIRAVMAAEEALCISDPNQPDNPVVFVNPAFEALTGYAAHEVMGRNCRFLTGPDTDPQARDKIRTTIAERRSCKVELLNYRKDGTAFWNELSISPIYNAMGAVTHFVGFQRDITARVEAEATIRQGARALHESETKLRLILDHLPALLWMTNEQLEMVAVHGNLLERLLRTPDSILGYSIPEIVESGDSEHVLVAAHLSALQGESSTGEVPTRSGHTLEVRVAPLRTAQQQLVGCVGLALDITERKQTEAALQASQARLTATIASALDAILVVDETHHVLLFNVAAAQLFQCPEQEAIGQSVERFIPALRLLADTAESGDPLTVRQVVAGRRANGESFPMEASLASIGVAGERLYTIFVRDITERERAEVARSQHIWQLQHLSQAAFAIHASKTVGEALQRLTDESRALIGAHQAVASLTIDQRWSQVVTSLSMSDKYRAYREFDVAPKGVGIYTLVCETNQPMRLTQEALERHPAWRNFSGHAHEHPPLYGWLAVPLIGRDGQNLGLIQLSERYEGDFTESDEAILLQLARIASIAIENGQLVTELRSAGERLQTLSRQLMTMQENERRSLARELHDEIGQSLTAVKINLLALRRQGKDSLEERVNDSLDLVDHTIGRVRALSLDLRPSVLDDLGLQAALRWHLDRHAQRAGLVLHLTYEVSTPRLPIEIETTCFRIVQEALTNILRHAQARHVQVLVRESEGHLHLSVCDDGVGFDVAAARASATSGSSLGILGMEERLALVGGHLELDSDPNRGTCLRAYLPLVSVL